MPAIAQYSEQCFSPSFGDMPSQDGAMFSTAGNDTESPDIDPNDTQSLGLGTANNSYSPTVPT
jgi:hypothetical protein